MHSPDREPVGRVPPQDSGVDIFNINASPSVPMLLRSFRVFFLSSFMPPHQTCLPHKPSQWQGRLWLPLTVSHNGDPNSIF